MKSILKWLGVLVIVNIVALILYQNYNMLLEKKEFFLFSEKIFGFSYGVSELPLIFYFLGCMVVGALFMAVPAFTAIVRYRLLLRKFNKMVPQDVYSSIDDDYVTRDSTPEIETVTEKESPGEE